MSLYCVINLVSRQLINTRFNKHDETKEFWVKQINLSRAKTITTVYRSMNCTQSTNNKSAETIKALYNHMRQKNICLHHRKNLRYERWKKDKTKINYLDSRQNNFKYSKLNLFFILFEFWPSQVQYIAYVL